MTFSNCARLLTTCLCLIFVVIGSAVAQEVPLLELNNLAYVEGADCDEKQKLNLILPQDERSDHALLIWVGGGAWAFVDKDVEMNLARKIAARGVAVASVGHRLSPAIWKDPRQDQGVVHPAHIEDLAQAFSWLEQRSEMFGYACEAIYVGGYSSGAHLSALLAVDHRRLKAVGLSPDRIRGVIPIAGTYDIEDYHSVFANSMKPFMAEQHVEAVFGSEREDRLDASPTSYPRGLTVPMLLISERQTYRYTKLFEEELFGRSRWLVTSAHFHGHDHGSLWNHLSNDPKSLCRDLIINFINEQTSSVPRLPQSRAS